LTISKAIAAQRIKAKEEMYLSLNLLRDVGRVLNDISHLISLTKAYLLPTVDRDVLLVPDYDGILNTS
jgi:hypothetical protein